jgi:high-affinity K+ transport system ATPase subunit B
MDLAGIPAKVVEIICFGVSISPTRNLNFTTPITNQSPITYFVVSPAIAGL